VLHRAVLLAGVSFLVTCSPGRPNEDSSAERPPQDFQVRSVIRHAEFGFEPITLRATAGVPVLLTLDNRKGGPDSGGGVPHTFTIDTWPRVGWLAQRLGHAVDIPVNAGEVAVGRFQLPPGTYEFYCSVFNHREAGMTATLVISDAD
jgi:plastocyanin